MDVLINKFCIVVPCFNEADRINLSEFRRLSLEGNTDLVFVNDGSSDETYELLSDFFENCQICYKYVPIYALFAIWFCNLFLLNLSKKI